MDESVSWLVFCYHALGFQPVQRSIGIIVTYIAFLIIFRMYVKQYTFHMMISFADNVGLHTLRKIMCIGILTNDMYSQLNKTQIRDKSPSAYACSAVALWRIKCRLLVQTGLEPVDSGSAVLSATDWATTPAIIHYNTSISLEGNVWRSGPHSTLLQWETVVYCRIVYWSRASCVLSYCVLASRQLCIVYWSIALPPRRHISVISFVPEPECLLNSRKVLLDHILWCYVYYLNPLIQDIFINLESR